MSKKQTLQQKLTKQMASVMSGDDVDLNKKLPEVIVKVLMPDQSLDDLIRKITEGERNNIESDSTNAPFQHIFIVTVDKGWAEKTEVEHSLTVVAFAGGGLEAGQAEQKKKIMTSLGAKFAQDNDGLPPMAVGLVSEAWMYKASPDEDVDMNKIPDEKKTEVMMIAGMTLDKRHSASFTSFTSEVKDGDRHITLDETEYQIVGNCQQEFYLLYYFYDGYFKQQMLQNAKKVD